ncbi:hypothetical protein D3C85_1705140 [compost metagenome]
MLDQGPPAIEARPARQILELQGNALLLQLADQFHHLYRVKAVVHQVLVGIEALCVFADQLQQARLQRRIVELRTHRQHAGAAEHPATAPGHVL